MNSESATASNVHSPSRYDSLVNLGQTAIFSLAIFPLLVSFLTAAPTTVPNTREAFKPINERSLPNAHIVTSKVISGGQPEGEDGFCALQKLGIRTIVSVDGAAPNLVLAHKYGMKYVHLPIAYEGVTKLQGEAIAKALTDEPGPIYLHCHHGKHRSAAAVTVACVYNGTIDPSQAESILQTFGTGENFKGLWEAAREARKLDPKEYEDLKIDFVETAKLEALASHMVAVDEHWDNVKLLQKNGWAAPADQARLDAVNEATLVQKHLREVARLDSTANRPDDFLEMLAESQSLTLKLQSALKASPMDHAAADTLVKQTTMSCNACHAEYRD